MNRVVKILMKRDNMSEADAIELVNETREEINEAIECGDFDYVDDIIADNLGLEPDYAMDILF